MSNSSSPQSFTDYLRNDPYMSPESVEKRNNMRDIIILGAGVVALGFVLTGHEKAAKITTGYAMMLAATSVGEKMLSDKLHSPTEKR